MCGICMCIPSYGGHVCADVFAASNFRSSLVRDGAWRHFPHPIYDHWNLVWPDLRQVTAAVSSWLWQPYCVQRHSQCTPPHLLTLCSPLPFPEYSLSQSGHLTASRTRLGSNYQRRWLSGKWVLRFGCAIFYRLLDTRFPADGAL